MPEGRMRCSANGASLRHKATFPPGERFRKRNLHLISQLTLTAVSLRLGQARFSVSPGDRFIAAPLLRSPQGEAKERVVPHGSQTNTFCPNTETFSAVHNISVVCLTRLARSPGGLGGRSRIEFIVSPLPRRRHNESHFAAQSPERSFFFPLFLSPRKKKRLLAAAQSENLCQLPPAPCPLPQINIPHKKQKRERS